MRPLRLSLCSRPYPCDDVRACASLYARKNDNIIVGTRARSAAVVLVSFSRRGRVARRVEAPERLLVRSRTVRTTPETGRRIR